MNDIVAAYIKGRQEGYFNVRLEYSILDKEQQCRAFFAKGYQIGKKNREAEELVQSNDRKENYRKIRKAYITIMGYKSGSEYDTTDSSLLKGEDRDAFRLGHKVGLLHRNGNIGQMGVEDLDIYMMATGYEISDEGYPVYLDMLTEKGSTPFQIGHDVQALCKSIKDSAIDELNQNQLNVFENIKKK